MSILHAIVACAVCLLAGFGGGTFYGHTLASKLIGKVEAAAGGLGQSAVKKG